MARKVGNAVEPQDAAFGALPSLNALHAFEVAARRLSFTRAARELRVTQTAVSHQIKQLEGELGSPLFRRAPRSLTLTPLGQLWYAEVASVFARLREANRKLRGAPNERPLVSLTTLPSFASRWLVPRLGGFLTQHPDIDVRISVTPALVDFSVEPVDVGIRYGTGHYPGLFSEKLADEAWLVVAAPALVERRRFRSPRDLLGENLLYDEQEPAHEAWFLAQGLQLRTQKRLTRFTDSAMVVEAALRGQGVAIARLSLVQDELLAGRLARLFPKLAPLPARRGYYLVGPRENFRRREVIAFQDWLRSEVRALVHALT